MNQSSNRAASAIFDDGPLHDGSNPARTHAIWMAHSRRAEIFALPFAFFALFCGYFVGAELKRGPR